MKVYIAICSETDPDTNYVSTHVLGAFSTPKLARNAFARQEIKKEKDGSTWTSKHSCFRGSHFVTDYLVDEWFAFGKTLTEYNI